MTKGLSGQARIMLVGGFVVFSLVGFAEARLLFPGPPPSQTGPYFHWDRGKVVSHGAIHSFEAPWSPWPSGDSVHIRHRNDHRFVLGIIRSEGYWEIIFRWQNDVPPAQPFYTVHVRSLAATNHLKNATGTSFVSIPGDRRMGWKIRTFDYVTRTVKAPVQHDKNGYYLSVSSYSMYSQVRQAKLFQPWSGDIDDSVDYDQPAPGV